MKLFPNRKLKRIRDHTSQYTQSSSAPAALFVVHPYFALLDGHKCDVNDELAQINASIQKYWAYDRNPDVKRELDKLRRLKRYLEDEKIFQHYQSRLENTVHGIDATRTKCVLVEDPDHYWEYSFRLVESEKVNNVLLTKSRKGELLSDEKEEFENLSRGVINGFIAGSNGFQCPLTFASYVRDLGMDVNPVRDLLYDPYNPPEEVLAEWERQGFQNESNRSISSKQLLRLKPLTRKG